MKGAGTSDRIQRTEKIENQTTEKMIEGPKIQKNRRPKVLLCT